MQTNSGNPFVPSVPTLAPAWCVVSLAIAIAACGSQSAAPASPPARETASEAGGGDDAAATTNGRPDDTAGADGSSPPGIDASMARIDSGDDSARPTDDASGSAQPEGGAASTVAQTLIPDPSWTCGMPAGIPPPAMGPVVFQADLTLGEIHDVGQTQYGHRLVIDVKGGMVSGPKIKGTLMNFGLDWQLTLSNGAIEDEMVDVIQTNDGTPIYFRDCGTAAGSSDQRIVPDFEAPTSSSYAWLNTGKFAGTRAFDATAKTLQLVVYDISGVTAPRSSVSVTDPPGVPNQTWDCKTASGTKTTTVYTETVGIGTSVTVGASKRGTRNIIPITGGTTSGMIQGGVLAGGGDFQLQNSTFNLDARYTLQTMDGELIVVRNCGPLGGLVPVYETRTNGPYAWVNANRWLSSDPTVVVGAVDLTIYDTR